MIGKDVLWAAGDRLHQQMCNFTAGTSPILASGATLAKGTSLPDPA